MIEKIVPARVMPGYLPTVMAAPDADMCAIGPWAMIVVYGPGRVEAGCPMDFDVRPHPHINMSVMSYLLEGAVTHRDGLGEEAEIRAGDVSWMVAGSGVVHSERLDRLRREGGMSHGVQAWVALPEADEEVAPSFGHYKADQHPRIEGRRARGKLLTGAGYGLEAQPRTHSPLFMAHWSLDADGAAPAPREHEQRAIYVLSGACRVGGQTLNAGDAALLQAGADAEASADAASEVLMFGGAPIGKRYLWWNYLSSRLDRLETAKQEWTSNAWPLPPNDRDDLIPLPPPEGRPLLTLDPNA